MNEQERILSGPEANNEEEAKVAGTETPEDTPLDDSQLEEVVAGASSEDFDRWHQLPDGSGSGAGE